MTTSWRPHSARLPPQNRVVPWPERTLPLHQRRCRPWHSVATAALALLLQFSQAQEITYNKPWPQCRVPSDVLQEKTGAVTEAVLSLCLTTYSGLKVTFDNADRFYVGNPTSAQSVTTACFRIDQIVTVQVINGSYTFSPGGLIPAQAQDQAWDLSLWPKFNPNLTQSVNLTVSNLGPTDIQFSGIDFAALGLAKDRVFTKGEVTAFEVDYSKVKLTYESLPALQEYLVGAKKPSISPGVVTAIVMVQNLEATATAVNQLVTYALVLYRPGNFNSEWDFFLYETTVSVTFTTRSKAGGRRLLVATAKNKAPPTACAKACCKPASPVPKGCNQGAKIFPACKKTCGCACK